MICHRLRLAAAVLLFGLAGTGAGFTRAAQPENCFAYTDSYRIVTIEFKGENLAILNFINLNDFVFVVEPVDILAIKTNGMAVTGQVFPEKTANGAVTYRASQMVQPRSVLGVDVLGAFQFKNDFLKVFFSQGGRFLELAAMPAPVFESLFSRLSQLDLTEKDTGRMLQQLAIPDYGVYIPFEEADSIRGIYERCLTDDGINPPKILVRTAPLLTDEARRANFSGLVEVKAALDKLGNVTRFSFSPPPEYGMAERIAETVRNGWRFLPATYNGEILATEIRFTIQFEAPHEPSQTQKP